MEEMPQISALAYQVAIYRRAKLYGKKLAIEIPALESELESVAERIEHESNSDTPDSDELITELMQEFLDLDQQLKVDRFEFDIIQKTLEDLSDIENKFHHQLNNLPEVVIQQKEPGPLILMCWEYQIKKQVIKEITDAIKAGTRTFRLLLQMQRKLEAAQNFNKIGDTYAETQILKKLVKHEIEESKRLLNVVYPELDLLAQEVKEVDEIVRRINEIPVDIYVLFDNRTLLVLLKKIESSQELQEISLHVYKVLEILAKLSRELRVRNFHLKHQLHQIKEQIIQVSEYR